MPKKIKQLTEEEKFKLVLAAEAELLQQRRQYTLLQRARSSYTSSSTLCKQRRVLNVLRTEYNEIETDLAVAESSENAVRDAKNAQHLQMLLDGHRQFKADIKLEKQYLDELDTQITLVKKRMLNLRRDSPNDLEDTKKLQRDKYTLEALENKLECHTKRFCLTLSENRKLREEINHYLMERAQFNSIWNKLLGSLATARKYMIDLIEMATISYDLREEWVQKLNILRNRAYNDYIAHTLEMTEMQRLIDEETKLENFFTIKGQKRIMKNLMDRELQRRELQRKNMQELIEQYTKSLDNIKEFMRETSIYKIVRKYVNIELANYARFEQVTVLNRDIEELGDEVAQLRMKIDDERFIMNERVETQADTIANLEQELEQYRSEADEAENEFSRTDKMLSDVLAGIERIFNQCKCSYTPFMELLGNNTTVNMFNADMFLQLLEKRINDIIINIHYKEKKKWGSHVNTKTVILDQRITFHSLTMNEMVTQDPCPLCIEKAMVSDVIDSLQKALSKGEIEEQLEFTKQQERFLEVIHNVSGCQLPKSRAILQARFE